MTNLKQEMIKVLKSLLNESVSRQEASKWASNIISNDEYTCSIEAKEWEVLEGIGGADLISSDRPYLYDKVDFKEWLSFLQTK